MLDRSMGQVAVKIERTLEQIKRRYAKVNEDIY